MLCLLEIKGHGKSFLLVIPHSDAFHYLNISSVFLHIIIQVIVKVTSYQETPSLPLIFRQGLLRRMPVLMSFS